MRFNRRFAHIRYVKWLVAKATSSFWSVIVRTKPVFVWLLAEPRSFERTFSWHNSCNLLMFTMSHDIEKPGKSQTFTAHIVVSGVYRTASQTQWINTTNLLVNTGREFDANLTKKVILKRQNWNLFIDWVSFSVFHDFSRTHPQKTLFSRIPWPVRTLMSNTLLLNKIKLI